MPRSIGAVFNSQRGCRVGEEIASHTVSCTPSRATIVVHPLTGPRVKFLREKLEKLGCEMPRQSFVCRPCEGMDISGGFVPPTKDAKGNLSLAEVRCSVLRGGVGCGGVTLLRSLVGTAYAQL